MKRFLILLSLLALAGCWDTDKTKPTPKPEPAKEHPAIVILHAPEATDLASYADVALDQYAEKHGYQGPRIHPANVVDESGKAPPTYLAPYVAAAKDRKLPVAMIGWGGKVHGTLEAVADSQAVIAFCEKTVGDPAVARNAFFAGGEFRKLGGLKPGRPGAEKRWTLEGSRASEPLIPEGQWVDRDIACYNGWTTDQKTYNSCCPSSGCAALATMADRSGLAADKWKLSVMDAYCQIAPSDSGAMLEDFWDAATSTGVCTTDFCPEQGWSRQPPRKDGYKASRSKHKALRVSYCDGWEGMASAIQRHKPVHFGVLVDSRFSPNADGIIGPKRGRSGGGHALLAIGMRKINGEWYILTRNSWGFSAPWNGSKSNNVPPGCCLLHHSYLEPAFGIFALSAVVCPSDDPITINMLPTQPAADEPTLRNSLPTALRPSATTRATAELLRRSQAGCVFSLCL